MTGLRRGAVLDIGSNSVRLIVLEWDDSGRWRTVDEGRAILRLGEALLRGGTLLPDLPRAAFACAGLVRWARRLGAEKIIAVGTAALRSAKDGEAFRAALEKATEVTIEVIDGNLEARLGFLGAMSSLDVPSGHLVDVGGASTELSAFDRGELLESASVPMGAVTLSRRHPLSDPPTREEIAVLKAEVASGFEGVSTTGNPLPLVAIGGSFRSVAKMDRAVRGYPFASLHNYRMAPEAVRGLFSRLASMTADERARVQGLAAHRAEASVAALALASALCDRLRPTEIVVSGSGIREGLVIDRILPRAAPGIRDPLESSVENLLFQMGEQEDEALVGTAKAMGDALSPLLPEPSAAPLLRAAARLRGIGRRVSVYDRHRHTFHIVAGASAMSIGHREQLVLAAAAGYEGPKPVRDALWAYAPLVRSEDVALARRVGLTVALAEALIRKFPGRRLAFSATMGAGGVALAVAGADAPPEILFDETERLRRQFPKAFGMKLLLTYTGADPS